jgi:hypothetical protein
MPVLLTEIADKINAKNQDATGTHPVPAVKTSPLDMLKDAFFKVVEFFLYFEENRNLSSLIGSMRASPEDVALLKNILMGISNMPLVRVPSTDDRSVQLIRLATLGNLGDSHAEDLRKLSADVGKGAEDLRREARMDIPEAYLNPQDSGELEDIPL